VFGCCAYDRGALSRWCLREDKPMRAWAAAMLMSLVAACTPTLSTFDKFVPKDAGGKLAAREIAYADGPRRTLDVYQPANAKNAPVIVFFYGGSWSSGTKSDYGFVGAAFAARGFVTIIPDYRLVPEIRFPSFVEDGAAAVRWARDHAGAYGGDPDRIVLVGHSAGAYNAAMIALDAAFLRNAGVDPRAVKGFAGLAGPYDFLPLDVTSTKDAFGAYPDLPATQPITYARADAPPALLLHGAKDTLVKPHNMESLAAHLRAVGAPVETKLYPDTAHVGIMLALSKPLRGRAPVLDDVAAFAGRVTAPVPRSPVTAVR
jgi:acetyl esterase/lipase